MPKLELIDGGGSGGCFSISPQAEEVLNALTESELAEVTDGFVRAYTKTLRLLANMQLQSFSPMENSIALSTLANDQVMFDVGNFGINCYVGHRGGNLHISIIKICRRSEISAYQRCQLSD